MKSTLVFLETKKILEALLFAAKEPLSLLQIAGLTGLPEESIEAVLNELAEEYKGKGINVLRIAEGYIWGTNPDCASYIELLRNFPKEARITPQGLETLAIIAYKQPVTKPEIERIRGVFSDGVIETLVARGLIEEKGRSDGPGRPILYGTTVEFLKHFGLQSHKDLPQPVA